MEKYFIENRKGLKVVIVVERPWFSGWLARGTAIVMHGLGADKEQKLVRASSTAFRKRGYITVRFDTTNSFGESGGDFKDATVGSAFDDLEDTVAWVRAQPWFREPLVLAGHSLGGMCTTMYAEKNPGLVTALAPMSPAVSGSLLLEAVELRFPETVKKWRETGVIEYGEDIPSYMKLLLPDNLESFLKYDLLPEAPQLKMPTLFMVGESDWLTPPHATQKLYEAVSGRKEFHVIPGAPHTFHAKEHIEQIHDLTLSWIDTLAR